MTPTSTTPTSTTPTPTKIKGKCKMMIDDFSCNSDNCDYTLVFDEST